MDRKQLFAMQGLERLRDRLRAMVNGEQTVDIGVLLQGLNHDIGNLGGTKVELTSEEIRSRFFVETKDPVGGNDPWEWK